MEIIDAVLFIIVLFVSAIILKSLIDGKNLRNTVTVKKLFEESQKGIRAIEHNNASPTIEQCFIGAKKVLADRNIEFSLESVISKGYSK